jgi:general secretion pathway protein F
MRFRSRVLDIHSRAVRQVELRAASLAEAGERLAADGAVVLALEAMADADVVVPPSTVSLLCRELKALLTAGLSVVEALDALAASAGVDSIHAALLERLRMGKSLSVAMADLGGFPALLIASVRASERTSDLAHALDAYLRFDDMMGTLRRRVISAALYPAIVVSLGGLIAVFLLLVVIPRFARLYGETGAQTSVATRALLGFSAVLAGSPWLVPVLLAAALLAVILVVRQGGPMALFRWLVGHVGWLGAQAAHFERARLYEALALLVRGGYSLHEAVLVSQTLSGSASVARQLSLARERIEHGGSASAAFAGAGLTDDITERLMRAGERGGQFDRVLAAIAERHRMSFETAVERATRVIEPLLLLAVALVVGGMVVLLYMPVFDIAGSVQ